MRQRLLAVVSIALKLFVIWLSVYPLLHPELPYYQGKAMGLRAPVYILAVLLLPAYWYWRRKPRPYPYLADIFVALPFAIDAAGNAFNLFATDWFDLAAHFVNWVFLVGAFGLAIAPLCRNRLEGAALAVGFGAVTHTLWEIGEFLSMKSGEFGLQLTYENTMLDFIYSFAGTLVAATLLVTVLWPKPGTPETPFGWRVEDA